MFKSQKTRKAAILTFVLASILFTAGAGQAVALDRSFDGDAGGNIVINLLERIGDFVSDLAVDIVDVLSKSGSSSTADG